MTFPRHTLLILGAGGDLTARLLLPGLAEVLHQRELDLDLVGVDRADWGDEGWRTRVAQSFAVSGLQGSRQDEVVGAARYVQADVTDRDSLERALTGSADRLIVYFALPPAVTVRACQALAGIDLPTDARLVLEKPFGTDVEGAEKLNDLVTGVVPEGQVYRVDHYLGMSTVLNILGLRFTNRVLESVLDNTQVESVDITFEESLALEGRAGYYDGTGALVDMIQSHALHVLSFLAMEPPSSIEARDIRDGTAAVLRATRVWDGDPVASSRRGRYTAGDVEGRSVPSYVDEPGVDPALETETYAEVTVEVNNWRWAGVPFRLRAGKALSALNKRATITFKQPAWVPRGLYGHESPDRVHIGLDPEVLQIDFNVTGPGDPRGVDRVAMNASFGTSHLPPYGQVLAGVLDGDPTLSVRGDHAVETWRIVEPVLEAWRNGAVPLEGYPAGTTLPRSGSPRGRVG
ncbi:glucose-6-phosphate dehydrogenase [Ornithinimicrobium sufpigmenti]|uniref:glucose-6-phosphate dehydrogenase n=1 Tax=Ornithinimicrobium sufpigmenti TaxID=2508882 RepID=UPI001035C0A5|nr:MULTISPECIES: glucose-6-phosphate dehydrogenase [unclassified Ornithinimicrobium]